MLRGGLKKKKVGKKVLLSLSTRVWHLVICQVSKDDRAGEGEGLVGDVNLGVFSREAVDKVFGIHELAEKGVQK